MSLDVAGGPFRDARVGIAARLAELRARWAAEVGRLPRSARDAYVERSARVAGGKAAAVVYGILLAVTFRGVEGWPAVLLGVVSPIFIGPARYLAGAFGAANAHAWLDGLGTGERSIEQLAHRGPLDELRERAVPLARASRLWDMAGRGALVSLTLFALALERHPIPWPIAAIGLVVPLIGLVAVARPPSRRFGLVLGALALAVFGALVEADAAWYGVPLAFQAAIVYGRAEHVLQATEAEDEALGR